MWKKTARKQWLLAIACIMHNGSQQEVLANF
jgi:hypothetical protein